MENFLTWLYYNIGRNINLLDEKDAIIKEYKHAIKGNHKYCKCKDKPKVVNIYWYKWHCTYCLKPKGTLNTSESTHPNFISSSS